MPVIQRTTVLAAGAIDQNVLSGSAFEFARTQQIVSIAVVASLATAFANIQSGSDIVLEETELVVKTSFPIIPDEFFYNDVAVQGDRLVIRVRNANAAANTIRTIVQVTNI